MKRWAGVALLALLYIEEGCKPGAAVDTPDARESPQASAMPAPLANAPTTTASAGLAANAATGTAAPLRGDERLPSDGAGRDAIGYSLSAVFHPADVIGPPRAPEVNALGIDAARKKTELRVAIDLTTSRLRAAMVGTGFVLPPETELRSRIDRPGHVVVWPGGTMYRPLPPGALRALFGERRFDVAPLTPAEIVPRDEPGKRIGIKTRKVDVATRAAKATFEVGKLVELGEGGVLLCRLLLDLMNAQPGAGLCTTDEAPVRAEIHWTAQGSIAFELTGVLRKTDVAAIAVPPSAASFASGAPPASAVHPMLTPAELAAFRVGPIDVPPPGQITSEQLVVWNPTVQLRVLYVDGVPAAWAAPGARDTLIGLQRGKYVMQWRTFLGDSVDAPFLQAVPGLVEVGNPDAGQR